MKNTKKLSMSIKAMALIFSQGLIANAFAGTNSGGGGNALVCFDNPSIPTQIRERSADGNLIDGSIRNEHISHIKKIEILDLVEAQYSKGFGVPKKVELVTINESESVTDFTKRLLKRIEGVAPILYEDLMSTLSKMPESEAVSQPEGLYPVDDYNLLGKIDSTNCVVATIAYHEFVNYVPNLYFDERLMFHQKHSQLSKAVTYLHEIVYATARKRGASDSKQVRGLVGTLLRKSLSVEEFKKAVQTTVFSDLVHSYPFSGRSDKLGMVYYSLNSNLSNYFLGLYNKNEVEIDKLKKSKMSELDLIATNKIKKIFPDLMCSEVSKCLFRLQQIYNSRLYTKEIKEKAYNLHSEYASFYESSSYESELFARIKVIEKHKNDVLNYYIKYFQTDILSAPGISENELKTVDNRIVNEIENNFGRLIVRSTNDNRHKEWVHDLFSDDSVLLKDISSQLNL